MAKDKITWKLEKRKTAGLVPAEYNPRTLSEKAKADLMESVVRFGQAEPIVINSDSTLIGGHQRVTVFADLGIEECDVMVPSRKLTKAEERELNLRLNKNTGEWDWRKLKDLFDVGELLDVGFEQDELSRFFDKLSETGEDDFDAEAEVASIVEPRAKAGDIYALGDHRLICGDSTDPGVFLALMGGVRADMVWTDPPYNVNYDYTSKYEAIRKPGKNRSKMSKAKMFNDKLKPEEFGEFLTKVFKNVYDFTKDSSGVYVCHATKSQEQFFDALKINKFHFSQTIIWLKERIILALGQDFHRIYEPIWYGWKEGKKRWSNKGMQTEKEVWDLDKMTFEERLDVWYLHRDKSKDYIHPTQKPVRLPERAIKKSCPIGGVVLEPFGGSGSTILACEQLGRKCYAVELDPRYVDAIIKRWEKFTGKQAQKI